MRRFYAISASLLLLAGLLLGCTRQAQDKADDKKNAQIDPKIQIDPVVIQKKDGGEEKQKGEPPVVGVSDDKQEKYEAALGDALNALAERKWNDALTAFEAAQAVNDSEFVQAEITKVKQRIEQDGNAKTTVKNLEAVLNDGKADDAVKLADVALREFGDGDDAGRLVLLSLQANALDSVGKKEDNDARFARFRKLGEDALAEKNLRAASLALEQALQSKADDDLEKKYEGIRARLETYDTQRKKAAELRRDSGQLEDALTALKDAASAWDTLQIRAEVEECQLALQKRRERVSVANFEVRNDVGMADAGVALAEEILPRLKSKFDLVERDQLNKVIDELKLENNLSNESTQQEELGKLAKVRYLVVGSVSRLVGVTIRARLVDVRTGLLVQTAKIVAPNMEEAMNLVPDLAKQLLMTDEEKLEYDAQAQQNAAKPAEPAPDNAVVPAAPLAPAADAPPPAPPAFNAPPPVFANMNADAFKVLAPPPANFVAPQPAPLVVQQRNRLLFATVEMGDFLFRAGRFGDAQKHYEFALVLAPDNLDIQIRLQRVRPFAPPVVVVVNQPVFYVKPRIAVLPFMTRGNPLVVPPSLSYWTQSNLAPYFGSRYEIVDPAEVYWYMRRMGMTMHDLMNDPNARRWLGRAVGVRYFVLGSCVETTSFDVNTYLLDAELGYLQGSATINVRNPYELKLRLAELAELTMMTPAERAAYLAAQQRQRFERLVLDGRRNMDALRFREAVADFEQALQIYPYNVQVQIYLAQARPQARFQEMLAESRQRAAAQQAALAAARQRQIDLAHASEQARRRAIAEAAARSEAERGIHIDLRVRAQGSLFTQAQVSLQTKHFGISVSLFQGAMDFAPRPVAGGPPPAPVPAAVFQDFAKARREAERAAELRNAELVAVREATLRKVREEQLQAAQKQLAAERVAAQAKLNAIQTSQAERDEQAYKAGVKQGLNYLGQNKYEAALAAFQGAQRVAQTAKQREQVNVFIDDIVQRQAVAIGKTQDEKDRIETKLRVERERRKAAESQAKNNEELYKLALQSAQQALTAKNLDTAQTKFEEAGQLYKTDIVLTGLRQVQSARSTLIAEAKKKEAEANKADTVKQLIADGNTALDGKKYSDAVVAFQQAKRLAPDNLNAIAGLTRAEQARDRLQTDARRTAEEAGRNQNFQRLVKSGQANLASKQYEAAVANLSEALKLNPTDASVQTALKQAQSGLGAKTTDVKAQTAAKLRTESYQKLLTEGQVALDSKRYADAIKAFTKAQEILPGDKASKEFLQDALTAKKSAEDAVAAAAKQRANEVKMAAELQKILTQGKAALAAKNYVAAEKLLAQAKAINPNDVSVQKALRDLDQAVQGADKEAAAQKQRLQQFQTALAAGKTALADKQYPDALKALSSATTLMPGNKEAQDLFRRAQAEARNAEETGAKAKLQESITTGQAALKAKNFDAAEKAFRSASLVDPTNPAIVQGLKAIEQGRKDAIASKTQAIFDQAIDAGQKAMAGKNYSAAIKAFTQATKLDPNDASARKMLQQAQQALADANDQAALIANYQKAITAGQTAMTAQKYDMAIKSFQQALKLLPNDQKATQLLQQAQKAADAPPKVKTPPVDNAKLFDQAMQKGEALEKNQKYSEAMKAYQEALKLRPKDADALAGMKKNQFAVHIVQGQEKLNKSMWMAAQADFEAALRIFSNSDQAKKLLQKAKSKMK